MPLRRYHGVPSPGGVLIPGTCFVSSVVERVLGKDEVVSSTLTRSSMCGNAQKSKR